MKAMSIQNSAEIESRKNADDSEVICNNYCYYSPRLESKKPIIENKVSKANHKNTKITQTKPREIRNLVNQSKRNQIIFETITESSKEELNKESNLCAQSELCKNASEKQTTKMFKESWAKNVDHKIHDCKLDSI